jgi:transposase
MAFLRQDRKGTEIYLRICETERIGKKVVQRTLHNLGKKSDYSPESLSRIGIQLYCMNGNNLQDLMQELCKEKGRYNYGFPLIINYLLDHYGLNDVLENIKRKHKLTFSLTDIVTLLLCNRWSDPLSKLGVYNTQNEFLGLQPMKLHWLYRSLDKLALASEELQKHIYNKNIKLLDYELDVVFYDVTTFYFDSDYEEPDALRQKGFGKDGKIGNTQILLALLIDKHRNPIGYELYSGDTYEGHTLVDGLKKLKEKYKINKVVVVADSGMLNNDNLLAINENGYEFIVGERLKNLPKKVKAELLDRNNYKLMTIEKHGKIDEKIVLSYHIVTHNDRKILCTYSEKRAKKDRIEREKKIEKAKEMMKKPTQLGKKAAIYYLKGNQVNTDTGEVADPKITKIIYELDQKKIEIAAQYDGLKAIATSDKTLTNEDILLKYKELYQIEQSFRTFKSFLETRPMFHWTDERIKGHFCMCYLSFALLNYLQQKLKANNLDYSENDIRKMLDKMQISHLQQFKQDYYIRSQLDENTKKLLKMIEIKPLPEMIANPLEIKYLSKKVVRN